LTLIMSVSRTLIYFALIIEHLITYRQVFQISI